jgi:transketolase N-terminal domain/subunit
MLRRDRCWPADDLAVDRISLTHDNAGPEEMRIDRTVELMGVSQPTKGRWESFGWTVSDVHAL